MIAPEIADCQPTTHCFQQLKDGNLLKFQQSLRLFKQFSLFLILDQYIQTQLVNAQST